MSPVLTRSAHQRRYTEPVLRVYVGTNLKQPVNQFHRTGFARRHQCGDAIGIALVYRRYSKREVCGCSDALGTNRLNDTMHLPSVAEGAELLWRLHIASNLRLSDRLSGAPDGMSASGTGKDLPRPTPACLVQRLRRAVRGQTVCRASAPSTLTAQELRALVAHLIVPGRRRCA